MNTRVVNEYVAEDVVGGVKCLRRISLCPDGWERPPGQAKRISHFRLDDITTIDKLWGRSVVQRPLTRLFFRSSRSGLQPNMPRKTVVWISTLAR